MRVFEIRGAVKGYQHLLPRDRKVSQMLENSPFWFDGRSKCHPSGARIRIRIVYNKTGLICG
jgi:hypothetical protein